VKVHVKHIKQVSTEQKKKNMALRRASRNVEVQEGTRQEGAQQQCIPQNWVWQEETSSVRRRVPA
jgi:hypothetical protein